LLTLYESVPGRSKLPDREAMLRIIPLPCFFINGRTLNIEIIVYYISSGFSRNTYRSGINLHSPPEVLVIFHQNRSRSNDSSTIDKNANWSELYFDFIDGLADSLFICCIEFPPFDFDAFFLD
jgi:hypothetical protein